MKITILQETLAQALKTVVKTVPSKPQLPILDSILLTATKQGVTLASTDLYMGTTAQLKATVEQEGVIAVPARVFTDTLVVLEPGEVTLELQETTLNVTTQKTSSTIQCFPADEFPEFPKPSGESYSFTSEELERIEKYVSFGVGTDQARIVLTTLLFEFGDQLRVVSTDGFRLCILDVSSQSSQESFSLLIPAKALREVLGIAQQQQLKQLDFSYSAEQKQLYFVLGEYQVYTRLIEGEYPPYRKILPSDFESQVEFDVVTFVQHLKQAGVFAREASNVVKLSLQEDELELSATSSVRGSFSAKMPVVVQKGTSFEIAFNLRYLLELCTAVKPERLQLLVNDSLKPALFREVGVDDFQYVAMPFRLNE